MRHHALFLVAAAALVSLTSGCAGWRCHDRPCYPTVTCEPIERECYEVECEEICVPGVTFYLNRWFKGRGCDDCTAQGHCECQCIQPNPGRVRVVRKLKVHEYECGVRPVAEWNPCDNGCCNGCDGCADFGTEASVPEPEAGDSASVPPPATGRIAPYPASSSARR